MEAPILIFASELKRLNLNPNEYFILSFIALEQALPQNGGYAKQNVSNLGRISGQTNSAVRKAIEKGMVSQIIETHPESIKRIRLNDIWFNFQLSLKPEKKKKIKINYGSKLATIFDNQLEIKCRLEKASFEKWLWNDVQIKHLKCIAKMINFKYAKRTSLSPNEVPETTKIDNFNVFLSAFITHGNDYHLANYFSPAMILSKFNEIYIALTKNAKSKTESSKKSIGSV